MQESASNTPEKEVKVIISHRKAVLRRLYKNPHVVVGATIMLIFILMAILAPILAPYDPFEQVPARRLLPPGSEHFMGTDNLGRDILSRLIFGARVTLLLSFSATFVGGALGTLLGLVSGYYGGPFDSIIMRVIDVFLAFPGILLALFLVTMLGTSAMNILIAIAFFAVPTFARITRGSVMSAKKLEFIDASRAVGATDSRIMFVHILPNIMTPLIVQATLLIATNILVIAALSFIGVGVQPPTPEWGSMIEGGREFVGRADHIMFFPGLFILCVVVGINILGDGLRDALGPKQTK
ncbi:MAG: ABC transporter permease [Oscillospiraceae bacterium]|nr:ABC transporter permease [Oscillospiraceae bacterium]